MQLQRFTASQTVMFPLPLVWEFFSNPENLAELTPPEAAFEVGEVDGPVYAGQILSHRVRILPGIKLNWVTEIVQVEPGRSFVDAQQSGPFGFWRHRHVFESEGDTTRVMDFVHWALPLDPLSRPVRFLVGKQVAGMFEHRQRVLPRVLHAFAQRAGAPGN